MRANPTRFVLALGVACVACSNTAEDGIPEVQQVEGVMLAGLWNGIAEVERYCDACIFVTTEMGKTALLRVVTYGDTTPNSIDVSPAAYAVLDMASSSSTHSTGRPQGSPANC